MLSVKKHLQLLASSHLSIFALDSQVLGERGQQFKV
jgi:hypothetical protein